MSKSASSEFLMFALLISVCSIEPPSIRDSEIPVFDIVDDEIIASFNVMSVSSPVKDELAMTLSLIRPRSIVVLANTLLLPVPLLNAEFSIVILFAVLSNISPLVNVDVLISTLFAVESAIDP
jgi:hypothetical protein